MYKTTFQNSFYFFIRSLTRTFALQSVFGKLFLTLLVFALSANGIPEWKKNNGKNFKSWTWELVKENQDILPPIPGLPSDLSHWSKRAGLQALNHNGKFYIFGGRTPISIPGVPIPGLSKIHGDVWSSSDKGANWERILASNPDFPAPPNHWANRAYFQAVKKGEYMYILGGQDFNIIDNPSFPNCGPFVPPEFCTPQIPFSRFFNDVWRSADGINWTQMINNIPIDPDASDPIHWAGRAGLSAVVFKGHIYVMGGSVNDDSAVVGGAPARIYFNDVWRSEDGSNWEKVNNAPWAPRAGGIGVVKDGYMYMIGGEEGFVCAPAIPGGPPSPCPPYFNDVWRTKDGVNWEEMTPEAEWSKRPGHQVVVAQDRLVLFGGFGLGDDNGVTPSNPSDVWVSNKGKVWKKVSDAPWNAAGSEDIKYDFDAVVVKGEGKSQDAIYTFGGDRETFDFSDLDNYKNVDNDVWKFGLPDKIKEENAEEKLLTLQPNYPNPFSGSTTLKYSLPGRSYVSIKIYDRYGQFVKTLVGKSQNEGSYEVSWDGSTYKNNPAQNGLYFATLWAGGKARTTKLIKN